MTTIEQRTTVVGVFNERSQAEQAIENLHQAGVQDDQIGFVVRHTPHVERIPDEHDNTPGTAAGALGGGILGGVVGAAVALLIPGLGPALAGGIIGAALGGAALGAATGSFIGAMTALGLSEEDAHYYQRELETGRVIVTVQARERAQEVQSLLLNAGALDASIHTDRATPQPVPEHGSNEVDEERTMVMPHVSPSAVNMKATPLTPYVPEKVAAPDPLSCNIVSGTRIDSVAHCDKASDRPNRNNIPLGSGM